MAKTKLVSFDVTITLTVPVDDPHDSSDWREDVINSLHVRSTLSKIKFYDLTVKEES